MKTFFKEPLVHFLMLGAVLFGIGLVRGDDAGPATNRITLSPGVVERLMDGFQKTWQRPPTAPEFQGLVTEYLREEVLYREALEMGLDRDDQIIRRRMRQKLEFLTADLVASIEPTEQDLEEYLGANPDRYRQEYTVSFTHVYFGDAEGTDPGRRAEGALRQMQAESDLDPQTMGDPMLLPPVYRDQRERGVFAALGPDFGDQMVDLPVGEWAGPVTSAYGLHLVRVDAFEPGRASELSDVRDAVYRDLTSERSREVEEQFFERLLAQYTVTVDWPEGMDPVEVPGVVR
jgi:hypothetical protein